jgi:hypothetical protein
MYEYFEECSYWYGLSGFTVGFAETISFCVTSYQVWDHTLNQTGQRKILPPPYL